jgi:hypothetical protein
MAGLISEPEHDAAIRYAGIARDYLRSIGAPCDYHHDDKRMHDLSEDECHRCALA